MDGYLTVRVQIVVEITPRNDKTKDGVPRRSCYLLANEQYQMCPENENNVNRKKKRGNLIFAAFISVQAGRT